MPNSHRSSITRRRYRLAQSLTVAGSIAFGALLVERLVAYFREDFFLFYGVDDSAYRDLQATTDARVPLTLGQLLVAAIAFVAVVAFIASERRRLRQSCALDRAGRSRSRHVVVERLRGASLIDAFVIRTSNFAGLLLSIWLLQSSLERWLGGLGLGIEYASWRSLLPLASVFGVCVLAGMLVAAVSLVGTRAIHVLELAFARTNRRVRNASLQLPLRFGPTDVARTVRELIGCDILSRPPPVAC
ncbi:MAG: hypothetical protein KDC46_03950 [Thermoleophilia bacterium]|nr:hypothetical protein [Thermoleophilia bacterium]